MAAPNPIPHGDGDSCPTHDELMAYRDGYLSEVESQSILEHLDVCEACRHFLSTHFDPVTVANHPHEIASFERSTSPHVVSPKRPAALELPCRLGNYELLSRIGRGGMGMVYRGIHLHLKKPVAVKVLTPERMANDEAVRRFYREMEAVGRVDHANVVRATDAGEANGRHFLAMELIEGSDLAHIIKAYGTIPVRSACEIARQAAEGLECIRKFELTHRDLKPSNLFLTNAGTVKILDLGLARLGESHEGVDDLSGTRTILGTPDYMAPEQWESSRLTDIRSDLYSLGCTLYSMLTGRPPFSGPDYATSGKKMLGHLERTPPPLSDLRPDVPPRLNQIASKLLAKKPEERYQTPADLARDLEPLTSGAELAEIARSLGGSNAATVVESGPSFSSPSRWKMIPFMIVLVLSLALIAKYTIFPSSSSEGPPAKQPRLPNEWSDLLTEAPLPVLWPNEDGKSLWNHDAAKKTLYVNCPGMAQLSIEPDAGENFELEASILQNPWVGGAGFYYDAPGPRKKSVVLFLDLFAVLGDPQSPKSINWGELTVVPGNEYVDRTQFSHVPRPKPGEHKLAMVVRDGNVVEARWDDAKLKFEGSRFHSRTNTTSEPRKIDLGLLVTYSSATFSNVRMRTLSPTTGDPP